MKIQRDEKGRFLPGNAAGPGRPRREVEENYLRILSDTCTPDAWRGICKRAVIDALQGDARARDWISNYLIGKPPTVIDLSAGDAVLLKQILEALEKRSIPASQLFEAMLYQVASGEDDQ